MILSQPETRFRGKNVKPIKGRKPFWVRSLISVLATHSAALLLGLLGYSRRFRLSLVESASVQKRAT
jgi:hypothetical protein